MAEHICDQCGASNARAAQFCHGCDAYLGWDKGATTIGGLPVAGTVPPVVEAVATEVSLAPQRAATPPGAPAPEDRAAAVVELPRVRPATLEVALTAGASVTVPLELYNASAVVDGFTIQPAQAPGWLQLTHPAVRLMPRQEGTVDLTVSIRGGVMVFAQRLPVRLLVTSEADPRQVTEVRLAVTVAAVGPPAGLDVQPRLLRLTDATRARFAVVVDNRAANFPQAFHLTGTDPEGVIQFGFLPSVVQAPAGQSVEVRGHFVTPSVPPGHDVTRQLTISARNDEGASTAVLTVVQHTSPEPEDVPVRVRLSPRELRVTNAVSADFEVHLDNRGGHTAIELGLTGRDPAHLLTFSLSPPRLVAPPGQVTIARGRVQAGPVTRGETAAYPFVVVATDGVTDVEAPGLLELTTTPAPLTTAELRVTPRNLTRADDRRATFTVEIDNVRGQEELPVRLAGADDHGMARVTFDPAALTVAPGAVARTQMVVDAPRPPRGQTVARELAITASDGEGRLAATATFTQVTGERGPLLRILLVLLGAGLVVLGALLPWFLAFGDGGARIIEAASGLRTLDGRFEQLLVAAAGTRVLLVAVALGMVLGLTGSGRLTRLAALLAVVLSVGYVVAAVALGEAFVLSVGLLAVWCGAVLAYAGGVLARPG